MKKSIVLLLLLLLLSACTQNYIRDNPEVCFAYLPETLPTRQEAFPQSLIDQVFAGNYENIDDEAIDVFYLNSNPTAAVNAVMNLTKKSRYPLEHSGNYVSKDGSKAVIFMDRREGIPNPAGNVHCNGIYTESATRYFYYAFIMEAQKNNELKLTILSKKIDSCIKHNTAASTFFVVGSLGILAPIIGYDAARCNSAIILRWWGDSNVKSYEASIKEAVTSKSGRSVTGGDVAPRW